MSAEATWPPAGGELHHPTPPPRPPAPHCLQTGARRDENGPCMAHLASTCQKAWPYALIVAGQRSHRPARQTRAP
eukprot:scaffold188542_cov30-Tisochrysis_lutea.AAC.2